jgi:hypothetical protein
MKEKKGALNLIAFIPNEKIKRVWEKKKPYLANNII